MVRLGLGRSMVGCGILLAYCCSVSCISCNFCSASAPELRMVPSLSQNGEPGAGGDLPPVRLCHKPIGSRSSALAMALVTDQRSPPLVGVLRKNFSATYVQ